MHCGRCTGNCDFLKKYALDLADFAQRPDLAYHCFLCGECAKVCPKGLDGRAIALAMRCAAPNTKGYGILLWEKKNYKFRNYSSGNGSKSKTVLFPGCNFPSFYPKTLNKLVEIFKKAGIGVVYDCCGKPVAELELGLSGVTKLENRLRLNDIEELIVLCPNCYYFLREKCLTEKSFKLTDIYTALRRLDIRGISDAIIKVTGDVNLFVPCPDRATGELAGVLTGFFARETSVKEIKGVQCCGMGGCAAGKEPDLAVNFPRKISAMELANVYTYCATCAGTLSRRGVQNVNHVLVEILNTAESPELTWRSVLNRAKLSRIRLGQG